jgi:Flp pilus assembly pilin Flp
MQGALCGVPTHGRYKLMQEGAYVKSARRSQRGQATTEYILIVVLVAILSIGIITIFGDSVRDLFRVASEQLAGDSTSRLNSGVTSGAKGEVQQTLSRLKE